MILFEFILISISLIEYLIGSNFLLFEFHFLKEILLKIEIFFFFYLFYKNNKYNKVKS